ncbi:nicotinic acid mononucleotide adenyltransferase [Parvularcula bermudensis HTCC2503]|uniref:Probable nicotinate-nucleotide adenylyltransferase n=1 Tax=Parvularcula bermudensis (strain ATCC BAA-594 / HTCC2503 / KCTC 12087) TaxID=314260 RepID=E0TFT8_PARBH|nr:nicotinate-nucleotide adenylyltransferase [Parvularcula bermudensis]ADM09103.1 nicotinic acid mononucleotide adenyltransferase [Parvularcula bermudensis HTCC2503]
MDEMTSRPPRRKVTAALEGGLSIGLLGGSFNPAHTGHLEVTVSVREQLRLDRCWWLVTPGNPLKPQGEYASLDRRVADANRFAIGRPWLTVTDIESHLGTRYTVDTLTALCRRFPKTRFVWIMGADNLFTFHHWRGWRQIASLLPIAVMSRPGYTLAATRSVAGQALRAYRVKERSVAALPFSEPPAWALLPTVHNPISSTAIRANVAGT